MEDRTALQNSAPLKYPTDLSWSSLFSQKGTKAKPLASLKPYLLDIKEGVVVVLADSGEAGKLWKVLGGLLYRKTTGVSYG